MALGEAAVRDLIAGFKEVVDHFFDRLEKLQISIGPLVIKFGSQGQA